MLYSQAREPGIQRVEEFIPNTQVSKSFFNQSEKLVDTVSGNLKIKCFFG